MFVFHNLAYAWVSFALLTAAWFQVGSTGYFTVNLNDNLWIANSFSFPTWLGVSSHSAHLLFQPIIVQLSVATRCCAGGSAESIALDKSMFLRLGEHDFALLQRYCKLKHSLLKKKFLNLIYSKFSCRSSRFLFSSQLFGNIRFIPCGDLSNEFNFNIRNYN